MAPVIIYQASAGSGKTYRLAFDCLRLLFRNPLTYRHILAVTFTHKATAEMKSRIIGELNKLATKKESDFRDPLCREFNLLPEEVNERAQKILMLILHDYGRFSVWTIDSFFQRVIQNFAREMGLSSGFMVELNNDRVLDEAIVHLMLEAGTNKTLRRWLVQYAEALMREGKSWKMTRQIKSLGMQLFREQFQANDQRLFEQLNNDAFITDYHDNLMAIQNKFYTRLRKAGEEAITLMQRFSLDPDDFRNRSRGLGCYLFKLFQGVIPDTWNILERSADKPEEWTARTSAKKEDIMKAYEGGMNDLVKDLLDYIHRNEPSYLTAHVILKNIYTLGILSVLSSGIRDQIRRKNLFLLSDAGKLLRRVIGNNEAPFIYEKIGSRFNHFMIDEFQDTSHFQWSNFLPLVRNSVSENHQNVVVGDVKQSIYRWRNSDWKILGREVYAAFDPGLVDTVSLDANWRSQENIIHFNNTFFSLAVNVIKEHLLKEKDNHSYIDARFAGWLSLLDMAYTNVVQKVPERLPPGKGYVRIEAIAGDDELTWTEAVKEQIPVWLERLQDNGYNPGETAILVRDHEKGRIILEAVAAYLAEGKGREGYTYTILSNESLFLSASSSVMIILALLRFLIRPDDRLNRAHLIHEYRKYFVGEETDDHAWFTAMDTNKFLTSGFLPDDFCLQIDHLRVLPLYDLAERLIHIFALGSRIEDLPYLQAFLDVLLEYQTKYASDIYSFLRWWDNGANEEYSVQLPDHQKAFRMMTIHKAKGLQFEAVLIPFCSWDFEPKSSTIMWCKPSAPPFNRMELVPVNYAAILTKTPFDEYYWNERISTYIDNLNLLYVAYTRAKTAMVVFVPVSRQHRFNAAKVVLSAFEKATTGELACDGSFLPLADHYNAEEGVFELGTLSTPVKQTAVVGAEEREIRMDSLPATDYNSRVRMRMNSLEYFNLTGTGRGERVHKGKLLHEIFERIRTPDDVRASVMKSCLEGKIDTTEAEHLIREIHDLVSAKGVRDWFAEGKQLRMEAEILLPGGRTFRPDRVMITGDKAIVVDYKFGEDEAPAHHEQVKKYCQLLKEMEYPRTEGWLWYVNKNKVVRVEQ